MIPGITASVRTAVASTLQFDAPLTEDLVDVEGGATPTFTRATTATVVDSTGTVISVASGEARFQGSTRNAENDWTTTGNSRGILIEEQRTSYADTTDDLTGGADTIDLTAGGTGDFTLSVSSDAAVTVAAGTATGTGFAQAVAGTPVTFNLSVTGTVTLTLNSGTLTTNANGEYEYNLEKGSFATSWIPTAGTPTTRNADVLTYDYQPPALLGSMTFTYNLIGTITLNTAYFIASGSDSRYVYKIANGSSLRAYDGTTANNYTAPATAGQSKYGLTWEDGGSPEVALYYNGAQAITSALDASGFDPAGSPMGIGNSGILPADVSTGILRYIKFYTEAKSQAFMEAETT